MKKLNFFLIFLFFSSLLTIFGIEKIFGEVNFRQIYYHVYFTFVERIIWFDKKHFIKIILYSFFIPFIFTLITFLIILFFKKKKILSENLVCLFFLFLLGVNSIVFISKYSVIKFFKK